MIIEPEDTGTSVNVIKCCLRVGIYDPIFSPGFSVFLLYKHLTTKILSLIFWRSLLTSINSLANAEHGNCCPNTVLCVALMQHAVNLTNCVKVWNVFVRTERLII